MAAVSPLSDPVAGTAPASIHLNTPILYLAFPPLFSLWDGVSMLSMTRLQGFLLGLLLLYLLVVWRGLRVATVANDLYSATVAGAIVVAFLFQVFVNVGMTMGITPITGIPLPLISTTYRSSAW